jgi:hypothetical protein
MALKARKDALRGLDGAFDPGAVRRKPARRRVEPAERQKLAA